MAVYVVDSNFFIDAHRANYPLDIAFSFWKKIKELATAGTIIRWIQAINATLP